MNEAIAVKFYDRVDDQPLKFAVIIKSVSKWVFCRHRERNTCTVRMKRWYCWTDSRMPGHICRYSPCLSVNLNENRI